ncbi:hypothetical protein BDR22DRAFT_894275 [Usnea florida]
MITSIGLLAALVILSAEAQQSISTSLLLPNGLFDAESPLQPPAFVGRVTVTRSTTYYTIGCNGSPSFDPGFCSDGSYTFDEISSNTQYLVESLEPDVDTTPVTGTSAAFSAPEDTLQTTTINCSPSPLATASSALCSSTYTFDDGTNTIITTVESSLYPIVFTAAAGYSATSGPPATPPPSPSLPTPSPTTTSTAHPSLTPSSKVGIGLGVPLGACALAGVALLLYRHGKHKERSRMSQMGNLAPARALVSASEAKKGAGADAGAGEQVLGRQPPVYSMEMPG